MCIRHFVWLVMFFVFTGFYAVGSNDTIVPLPAVEIRATRFFSPEQAGMKQTRLDSLVLSQKLHLSMSELLAQNTPIYIKNHGRGALATASFRGTAPSHTRVNWNGLPVNTPMAGMVDFSLIPVFVMDEVGLKHGTASLADQSGGLGGSISIANRPRWSTGGHFDYTQMFGSFDTRSEYVQAGYGDTFWQYRFRAYQNQSANDFPFVNRWVGHLVDGEIVHPLDTNKNADYRHLGFLQEFDYRIDNTHGFSLRWWSQWADRSIPRVTSYEGPAEANLGRQRDVDHRAVADWRWYLPSSRWLFRLGHTLKHLDYSLTNQVHGMGEIIVLHSMSRQKSLVGHIAHRWDVDGNLVVEQSLDANFDNVISRDTLQHIGFRQGRDHLSYLFNLTHGVGSFLNLQLMLRQDWADGNRQPLTPFFGADLKPFANLDMKLRANVARNHNLPSLSDLYWQPGGNPDLLPEEGISAEIGVHHRHDFGLVLMDWEAGYYHSNIRNWILWVPSFKGYWEPRNVKKVSSRGLELNLGLEGRLGTLGYRTNMAYAMTRAINLGDPGVWGDLSHGKQLVFIPVHSGNAMIHITWRDFHFGWHHHSYSERYTTSSNDLSRRHRLQPHFMNDVSMGKTLKIGSLQWLAEVKINNLFNEDYRSELHQPMPGRHYLLMLTLGLEQHGRKEREVKY